ncbi:MAG: DUF2330 domain-containing protein [Chloroflexi bacterium]|nr:DUF2330 domain-containing protein [Chloroflexota bacterium]
MRRLLFTTIGVVAALVMAVQVGPSLAHACAGLIGSNGAVNLGRTTTLAAYEDGVEHYVTAFQFQGGGGEFGTLIPLPGVPSNVERGGAWTLQRLQLEVPSSERLELASAGFSALTADAEVLLTVRIDALDITVLRGGGPSVAAWATDHGFRLSPDAPEVLEFYAERSPIFLAAVFDGDAAAERGQVIGDGTPVHITIPTENPWVPLRILALGKQPDDRVEADVFLLTAERPALLPLYKPGLTLVHSDAATQSLLDDLRSDDGMGWVPESAWLSKLQIDSSAGDLSYDLAIDASGLSAPSPVAAGLVAPLGTAGLPETATLAGGAILLLVLISSLALRRSSSTSTS